MKKLFSLFLILLLIINIASATRFVNYNFKEGRIDANGNFMATDSPVNWVNVAGYVCLDKNCETLGKKIFITKQDSYNGVPNPGFGILNSGMNSWIQLFYPTELLNENGYAVYYYKEGFIPWEANPNWFGIDASDPQGPYNVYLSKKEVCSSEITEVKIRNSERENTPVVIDVQAELDAKTKAAISNAGPLNAVPEELKEQYSVRTLVSLDIIDNEGFNVFSDEQEALIGFGQEENINFEFIPEEGDAGSYTALVTTKVTDEKCLESEDKFAEKEFVVLEENPLNSCYTDLSSLELSSFNVRPGHDLLLKLNKISNFQENIENEIIKPIETILDVQLFDENGEVVNWNTFTFAANENSVDPKNVEILFNIPEFLEDGTYQLLVTGNGNYPGCIDQRTDTLKEYIFVEDGGMFGNAPEIISQPVTKAELEKTYVYDVEAFDLDNDQLTYFVFGPDGMEVNSETGLITWFVDENKFKVGEKHVAVAIVTDGFFFDAQVVYIDVVEEVEKREKKVHEFRFSGVDLQSSDTENGITGFLLLKNDGDFKENKVSVYADIYDLDVHEILTSNINLGTEDSFWVPIDVKVPSNTKEGEYLLNIRVENAKHKEEQRFVVFIENNDKEKVRVITSP